MTNVKNGTAMTGKREYRTLYRKDLHDLCIEKNWLGHNNIPKDYVEILDFATKQKNVTADIIVIIAGYFLKYCEAEQTMESIYIDIENICVSHFE